MFRQRPLRRGWRVGLDDFASAMFDLRMLLRRIAGWLRPEWVERVKLAVTDVFAAVDEKLQSLRR